MTPSAKHYCQYDAIKFDAEGFIKLSGGVQRLSRTRQHWCVSVVCHTQDKDGGEIQQDKFTFKTDSPCMLRDLRAIISKKILDDNNDYKEVCLKILVTARVML